MKPNDPAAAWLRRYRPESGPIYRALANALETAIAEGELQPGDQLPPQRAVAELLGVDFTTVTRAYGEARQRGLVEGAVGRGTFVRRGAAEDEAGRVDLSMNLPPPPAGVSLGALLKETAQAVLARTDPATLMAYHPGAGSLGQRLAGAAWLEPVLGPVAPERVLLAPGAQTALAALLCRLVGAGGSLVVDALTYPGVLGLAAQFGLRLLPCPGDQDGMRPDALDRICAEQAPAAVYLIPTTHNPTAVTMPLARRRQIAETVERRGLWMVEDDPYSRLFDAPLPALASLAPERTFHLATLSKCLTPGLRAAFVAAPSTDQAVALEAGLRAMSLMTAPLMAAVAAAWIREGQAAALLAGVRVEARARRALAAQLLPQALGAPESLHIWLEVAGSPAELQAAAQAKGLSLVTAEAFAAGREHPSGVRISLGGASRREVLGPALATIAELAGARPSRRAIV